MFWPTPSCQPAWRRACVSLELQLSCTVWSESLLSARARRTVMMWKSLHARRQRAAKMFLTVYSHFWETQNFTC